MGTGSVEGMTVSSGAHLALSAQYDLASLFAGKLSLGDHTRPNAVTPEVAPSSGFCRFYEPQPSVKIRKLSSHVVRPGDGFDATDSDTLFTKHVRGLRRDGPAENIWAQLFGADDGWLASPVGVAASGVAEGRRFAGGEAPADRR
eukprot:g15136.t1